MIPAECTNSFGLYSLLVDADQSPGATSGLIAAQRDIRRRTAMSCH
jgi:hypothetical protein